MVRRFVKVSEEKVKTAFFYPSDLVKLIVKQLSPSGSVKSGGYIPRSFVSQYISTTIHLPLGDSCIVLLTHGFNIHFKHFLNGVISPLFACHGLSFLFHFPFKAAVQSFLLKLEAKALIHYIHY